MKRKKIAVLGSTGSIGTQTLELIEAFPDLFEVKALVAYSDKALLTKQQKRFGAEFAGLIDESLYESGSAIQFGAQCLENAVDLDVDVVLVATRGIAALRAVIKAINKGVDVALANKETLVCGGALVAEALSISKAKLLPVDSEHSAVWQCLGKGEIRRLILTASGGPFFGFTAESLSDVTPEMALKHPNWSMGSKITIDSATMMNKGLEILEAHWLFGVPLEQIDVVVHPQSIVHSMVELVDGTVIAQLGVPDMGLPIQLAMTYPERKASPFEHLDFYAMKDMSFEAPDYEKTPCLKLAMDCARRGGTAPCIMSAANEVAVAMFLNHRLGYNRIYDCALQAVESIEIVNKPDLEAVLAADEQARVFVREHFS